jgi:ribosome maturation protein SDO1
MVSVEEAVIARLKTHGANFEILVDCDKAIAFKGGSGDIKDVLATPQVFSDSKKGMLASETQLKQIFGTEEPLEVAKEIIKKGEIQLTSEYRTKLREQKRKKIINMIHSNGVDPKTNYPHPPNRIEAALDEAKVKIDEYLPAEKQIDNILKQIRAIIPIKFVIKEIAIKVPSQYAGKASSSIRNFGKLLKEDWQKDGSWIAVIEIPGGLEEELHSLLNNITHGDVETKILKTR